MACFSCAKSLKITEQQVIRRFYDIFRQTGKEYYFYKLGTDHPVKIISKNLFSSVYANEIKPNLQNGATYAHISEFKGT